MNGDNDTREEDGSELDAEGAQDGQEAAQDAEGAQDGQEAAQDAAGAQDGQEAAQEEDQGEERPRKGGDVGKALRSERERRKLAEEISRRLSERLEQLGRAEAGEPLKLEVGDEDILDGKQVRALFEQQRGSILQDVGRQVAAQMRATELVNYIDSFEAFRLETPIGSLGREALTARLAGLKTVSTAAGLAEAKEMVEAVAREVSAHQVAGQSAAERRGQDGARTIRPGPGASTATHIVPQREAPGSLEEASAKASRDVWAFAKAAAKKVGLS